MRIRDLRIFLTLYPGWKIFGSEINIPDPQRWKPVKLFHVQSAEALKSFVGDSEENTTRYIKFKILPDGKS
jgi:hypothetical protein